MLLTNVNSSNIASAGHDPESNIMVIQFRNGATYQYLNIPEQTYQDMLNAPSIGQYFNSHIRGKFEYNKINVTSPGA